MRLLWSCVLAAGLFLVGLEVYEGTRTTATPTAPVGDVNILEDGTPMPPPPPPPPTK